VYYILYYCMPNRIPCGLQSCTQLVQGATKIWKIECNNTQHISCPVCSMFLIEFGIGSWWTCELWLIVDGIIMAPAACRLSCCLYWMCAVWCVELGMHRDVWWSLILPIKIYDQCFLYTLCADCIGKYTACCAR
jgi:hypothetical protein